MCRARRQLLPGGVGEARVPIPRDLPAARHPWYRRPRRCPGTLATGHQELHGTPLTNDKPQWLASNNWIRDAFLLSDPGTVGAGGPNQNTSRIQYKEVCLNCISFMIAILLQAVPPTARTDCGYDGITCSYARSVAAACQERFAIGIRIHASCHVNSSRQRTCIFC